MSEEQPHAQKYPVWPEICNPTKKLYDPFEEYSAYDGQRKEEEQKPKTVLDEKIDQYSYFRNTTIKTVRNPFTGEWQKYTARYPKRQEPSPDEEQQRPEPPREHYGPYRICP
ncbi:hypothetical protein HY485_00360 [Candidatus Woesearchaeota archaeon]|nr:hypothetical protein [Candidatus Woesearchaeota archaeon]